jgi:hypothetical protein
MGCGGSTPTSPAPTSPAHGGGATGLISGLALSSDFMLGDMFRLVYTALISGCDTFPAAHNMMPIVCLGKDSFPLVLSTVDPDECLSVTVELPIVAGAFAGRGRVLCFSQVEVLLTDKENDSMLISPPLHFFRNAFGWLSAMSLSMTTTFVYGFAKSHQPLIRRTLDAMGLFSEFGHLQDFNPSVHQLIVIPSNLKTDAAKLRHILEIVRREGKGLAVFYVHEPQQWFPIAVNDILNEMGLGFTYSVMNSGVESVPDLPFIAECDKRKISNLPNLVSRLRELLSGSSPDPFEVENLVRAMRYYILICDSRQADLLREVYQFCWEFLERTEYRSESGLFSSVAQVNTALLILDVILSLPTGDVKAIPDHRDFPGETGEVSIEDFELTISPEGGCWVSTGLWAVAGVGVEIEVGEIATDLSIQIGSQCEDLFGEFGAHQRWPMVLTIKAITSKRVELVSPFGGMIYVTSKGFGGRTGGVDIKFRNVCRYPRAVSQDGLVWEETKGFPVPWGEIVIDCLTITVPVEWMKKLDTGGLSKVYRFYGSALKSISECTKPKGRVAHRIVFDVELVDGPPSCGYPLIFGVEDIEPLLVNIDKPSTKLFIVITFLSILSIRENALDDDTIMAVGLVVATKIFKDNFPGFAAGKVEGICFPPLFSILWDLHSSYDATLLPNTISIFQDPEYQISGVGLDQWHAFVRELCLGGRQNFTKVLSRLRPIPMHLTTLAQGFPVYEEFG